MECPTRRRPTSLRVYGQKMMVAWDSVCPITKNSSRRLCCRPKSNASPEAIVFLTEHCYNPLGCILRQSLHLAECIIQLRSRKKSRSSEKTSHTKLVPILVERPHSTIKACDTWRKRSNDDLSEWKTDKYLSTISWALTRSSKFFNGRHMVRLNFKSSTRMIS